MCVLIRHAFYESLMEECDLNTNTEGPSDCEFTAFLLLFACEKGIIVKLTDFHCAPTSLSRKMFCKICDVLGKSRTLERTRNFQFLG